MDIKDFADKYKNESKVIITDLMKGTIIYFFTEHSQYSIEIVDPLNAKVIASGGYFKRRGIGPKETYIIGSTIGGSMIFTHQLIEGLLCEFDNNVITSTIKKIFINYSN